MSRRRRRVEDPLTKWLEEHGDELLKYAGQVVAIHPTRGVVAHGPDLVAVADEVDRLGLRDEVTFDAVWDSAPAGAPWPVLDEGDTP